MLKIYVIISILLITLISSKKDSPVCEESQKYCSKCNPVTNICIKCQNELFTPDSLGGCIGKKSCTVGRHYCEECSKDGELCKTCESGFFPDLNGACSYIQNCAYSYRGKCLECKEGFLLIGNGEEGFKLCKSLNSQDFLNCKSIDENTGLCEECEEGFYLGEGDKKCTSNEKCYESIYDHCISCTNDYYLDIKDKKTCKSYSKDRKLTNCAISEDGETCSECKEGYYFDKENNCVSTNNCEKSENFECIKCLPDFYLLEQNAVCVYDKNCRLGDRDNGLCTFCNKHYYIDLNEGTCKSNQEEDDLIHCTIFHEGQCIACEEGYYLSGDNECSFTENCERAEVGKCLECFDGFYLGKDHKCTNVPYCTRSNKNYQCEECQEGFYINRFGSCIIAENKFKNCKISSYDGKKCAQCREDFYLLLNDSLCYEIDNVNAKNKEKYEHCEEYDGEKCVKCKEGYFLGSIDHLCKNLTNCGLSEEGKCIICDDEDFYVLDLSTGTCESNDLIDEDKKFYYRCKVTNKKGNACEECIGNYTLTKEGLCFNNNDCQEKDKDGNCIKCNSFDNSSATFCLNPTFGCVETFYNRNCWKCNNDADILTCNKCLDGYTLENGLCYEYLKDKNKKDKEEKEDE